jgi:hypothetical protein
VSGDQLRRATVYSRDPGGRLTAADHRDPAVDLVIELEPENVRRAFAALESLGYRPRVPVTASGFADPEMRRSWIEEENMTVLNFDSDRFRATPVDIFVEEPFAFHDAHEKAVVADVNGVEVRIVDLETLIAMKEAAGRPIDLDDVRHLRLLADEQRRDGGGS